MSDNENLLPTPLPGTITEQRGDEPGWVPSADLSSVLGWLRQRQVLVAGVLLIVFQLGWKAHDVHHLYFYQDDYVNLDKALESSFSWHYLILIGDGHFFPGVRAVTWLLARGTLYDWNLDSALLLVLLAGASLAALQLLRTLFGERPAILIPLAIYLLIPLTVPDFGWLWAGIESLPFQIALFMALHSHVLYVRTSRTRHLVAASLWLVLGMLFFEKTMVLPLLLFAITAGYLMGTGSLLAGAIATLRTHRRAWLIYAVLTLAYAGLFYEAFHTQGSQLSTPPSTATALTFAWVLVRTTLLTGAIGGPWQWLPAPSKLYALAAPPTIGVWLAVLVAVAVVGASIWMRAKAWRAWAILAAWIVLADMIPVLLARLSSGFAVIFGLETRYLADAACVLAICVGLAFLPVAGVPQQAPATSGLRRKAKVISPQWRYLAAAFVGVFAIGSILSVQAYERATTGAQAPISYMANAEQAIKLSAQGTNVLNQAVPAQMVNFIFGNYALESHIIGDTDRGRVRWITRPDGTIDGLRMFGSNGKLYPALISGVYSVHRKQTGFKECWPVRNDQIRVWLQGRTNVFDSTLRLSYIWGGGPGSVLVQYGRTEYQVNVRHGAHTAYLPVSGSVLSFTVAGLVGNDICVSGAAAGHLVPF